MRGSYGLSTRRARTTKSRGQKGLNLEAGAQRAPDFQLQISILSQNKMLKEFKNSSKHKLVPIFFLSYGNVLFICWKGGIGKLYCYHIFLIHSCLCCNIQESQMRSTVSSLIIKKVPGKEITSDKSRQIKNIKQRQKHSTERNTTKVSLSSDENHLSKDVEDCKAEKRKDVLHIIEMGSSNSFHILIGAGLKF